MSDKLINILNKLGAEVLSEDAKKQLISDFENLVKEKAQIHIESAKEKLDAEHAQLLEKLLTSIDTDHANKFKIAMERVDKSYAAKLKLCKEKFNKIISKDAKNFKNKLTSALSMYLEQALKEYVPEKMISEAVSAKHNAKLLENLRSVLGVDLAFSNKQTVSAFKKQHSQISEAKQQLYKLQRKNKLLSEQAKQISKTLLMERVYDKLNNSDEREFMKKRMTGKTLEYIKENFDYVLKLYRNEKTVIREDVKDALKTKIINEKINSGNIIKHINKPIYNEQVDSIMNDYMSVLSD